jgi:hypothetical protein
MKVNQITPEQFALETRKFLDQARRAPVVIRAAKGEALVIRSVSNDDLADELLTANPRFRASIRRARRNRAAGRGVALADVRAMVE